MRKYKLSNNYIIQEVGSDTVLLPCGTDDNVDLSKMIVLNETGAFLTSAMEQTYVSFDQLMKGIIETFENVPSNIEDDIKDFIEEMLTHGILCIKDDDE